MRKRSPRIPRPLATVFAVLFCCLTGLGQANLPTSYAWDPSTSLPTGWTATGMGTPYGTGHDAPNAGKFDSSNDVLVIAFTNTPGPLSYWLKGNPSAGTTITGVFEVAESLDGTNYSPLATITNKNSAWESFTNQPAAGSRFIRFLYASKVSGNLGIDDVLLAAAPPVNTLPLFRFATPTSSVVSEGDAPLSVAVSISFPADATLHVATAGSATLNADYSISATDLVFSASGATSQVLSVTIVDDATPETAESFTLALSGSGALPADPTNIVVTILDNEASVYLVPLVNQAVESAGSLSVLVQKSAPVGNVSGTLNLTGTATPGTDYSISGIPFTLNGGVTSVTVNVQAVDDSQIEDAETIHLSFSGVTGASVGEPAAATLTIIDDDGITVLTANLSEQLSAFSSSYSEYAGRIFQGLKPDVAALQEFTVTNAGGTRAYVDTYFGTNFALFVEPTTNNSGAMPNAIVSKWPILQAGEWTDTNVNNRDFAWVTLDLPGTQDLHVISVHIKASTGVLAEDIAKREAEALALTAYITNSFPSSDFVLLCGDLNAEDRAEPALRILTNLLVDARQPADQNDDRETNRSRDKPFDFILPNRTFASNEIPTVFAGVTFPEGMVFDSSLWSPLPSPILAGDSYATGRQHMAVMKTFALQPMPAGFREPANVLAYYDFEDAAGQYETSVHQTHAMISASVYATDDAATTNTVGKSGRAISDTAWKDTTHHYRFTLQVQTGQTVAVTGLQFFGRSTASGPTRWILRSSVDNYASDLATGVQSNDSAWYRQSASFALGGVTSSVTFRLYGTNASSSAGTWAHDSVKVFGSVAPITPDSDGDGIPDAWELQYFVNLGAAGNDTDWDDDGMSDASEYLAGTSPTDPSSLLRFSRLSASGSGIQLSWDSAGARYYSVERSTNLTVGFQAVVTSLAATPSTNSWTDTEAGGSGAVFYRIRLGP